MQQLSELPSCLVTSVIQHHATLDLFIGRCGLSGAELAGRYSATAQPNMYLQYMNILSSPHSSVYTKINLPHILYVSSIGILLKHIDGMRHWRRVSSAKAANVSVPCRALIAPSFSCALLVQAVRSSKRFQWEGACAILKL
jgi:hypothetical protein